MTTLPEVGLPIVCPKTKLISEKLNVCFTLELEIIFKGSLNIEISIAQNIVRNNFKYLKFKTVVIDNRRNIVIIYD